ncbi:hypothetical protein Tco_0955302 [Tanacetum coccineum]|uniref:Uncharacterized protein n=1 Tax=Tanacetum coccineum TaxID=301880 RepID=A0ABQ5E6X2_9ASTR
MLNIRNRTWNLPSQIIDVDCRIGLASTYCQTNRLPGVDTNSRGEIISQGSSAHEDGEFVDAGNCDSVKDQQSNIFHCKCEEKDSVNMGQLCPKKLRDRRAKHAIELKFIMELLVKWKTVNPIY